MIPTSLPGGTLSQIDNPLVSGVPGATGSPVPQPTGSPQPTAQDTAQAGPSALQNPVSGGANLAQILASRGQAQPQGRKSQFASSVGDNVNKALTANPQIASQPGGTMRAIVGAGLQALSGVSAGLGDAAAVGTVSPGGGWLQGVERTQAAGTQRVAQQKMQQSELDKNAAMTAQANVQMMKEQRLIHNMDEEAKQTSMTNGKAQLDAMNSSGAKFDTIAKDLTYDQIGPYIKNNKIDPSRETAIPTGIKTIGQDKDGKPITALTYTLTQIPENVTLDADNADQKQALDFLNQYNPPSGGGKWEGKNGQPVNFTGPQFNLLMQQAHDKVAAKMALDKAGIAANIEQAEVSKKKESLNFAADPGVVSALAHANNANGVPDVISARNALLQQSQDPKSPMFGKYKNIDNDMREYYGEKNYDKMLDDYQKKQDEFGNHLQDLSKKLDTASGEQVAGIAAGLQAQLKDPATSAAQKPQIQRMLDRATAQVTASEDFKIRQEENAALAKKRIDEQEPVASPADQALVRQIGEGRSSYPNPRTKEGQRIAKLVAVAYPDYDEGKANAWFQWRKDFDNQSIGHFGGALASANATMAHMQRLYEHTTLNGLLNPFSDDHNRMNTDTTFIEGELGKAVKGGVITEGESKQIRAALSGGVTVENKRERLKEASLLLQDKIDGQQKRLERDIVPSSHISTPQLITPEAKASFDYMQSGGTEGKSITQTQQKMAQQHESDNAPKQAPKGAVDANQFGKAANGQVVWKMSDGTVQDAQGRQYGPNGLPK